MAEKKITPDQVWQTFISIDVSDKTRDFFNGRITLSYLSWTHAIHILMEEFPSSEWGFDPNEVHNDGSITVHSWVRIGDITRRMQLPVMNKKKNAELNPDARVINDNKMRCLTKNLAVWGLGLHVFHGEDFPSEDDDDDKNVVEKVIPKKEPKKTAIKKEEPKKTEKVIEDDFSIFDEPEVNKKTEKVLSDDYEIPDFETGQATATVNEKKEQVIDNNGKPVSFAIKGDNDFSLIIEQFLKFSEMHKTAEDLKKYWIANGKLMLQIKKENSDQFKEMKLKFIEYGEKL